MNEPQRILVVDVNWLGDCVMSLPAFTAIKKKYPGCSLAVMVPDRVAFLFEDQPAVDEIIIFDERAGQRTLFSKIAFVRALRARRFDRVYMIHRSMTKLMICFFAGIPERIGFSRKKNDWLLTHKVSCAGLPAHRGDRYLALFERSGIPVEDNIPGFIVSREETEKASTKFRLTGPQRFVVFNVAANWPQKRWPVSYFIKLAQLIVAAGIKVAVIGAASDRPLIDGFISGMEGNEVIDLCGRTTLPELAAVLHLCALVVSADSGPAHLAAAAGTEVIVLFGPTDKEQTAPRGKKITLIAGKTGCVIPCYDSGCADNRCMKSITVEEVFDAAQKKLGIT